MKRRKYLGQSMVEMALLLPFLVMVLFGTIDFGYYIFAYQTVESAARRGSEQATLTPPTVGSYTGVTGNDCADKIVSKARLGVVPLNIPVTGVTISYPAASGTYPPTPTRAIGNPIDVTVTYTVKWLSPLGPLFGLGTSKVVSFTSRRTILKANLSAVDYPTC